MTMISERRGSDGLTKAERASLKDPALYEIEQVTACQFIAHHSTGEEFCLIAFRDGSFSITSNTGAVHAVDHMLGCDCEDANYRQPTPCGSCKHASCAIALERWQEQQERAAAKAQAEIDAEFDTAAAAREASREQTRREQAAEQAERTRKVGQELAEIFGG